MTADTRNINHIRHPNKVLLNLQTLSSEDHHRFRELAKDRSLEMTDKRYLQNG